MIGKSEACYNCDKFVSVGFVTGHYKIGYCTLNEVSNWVNSATSWDKAPCSNYVTDSIKTTEFLNSGNIVGED